MMTTNSASPTFRGVECLHCKAPVPVPSIVSNESAGNDGGEASQRKSQVFNLRCPYCHKEKPYRTREIVVFKGTAQEILAFERPVPVRWYPQPSLTRTAKA